MDDVKHIIESLLFVAEEPLGLERLKKILPQADAGEIRGAVEELQAEYEQRRCGFYLAEVAGGFQFRTRPEYNEWIRRLLDPKPLRLSKAALETLAIIAYKQPVIRSDVEHIRGVDCGGVLRQLLERKLIRVLGRKEIAGRPLIYATTKKFLETFDLKDLKDLPTPKEIEEFGKAPLEERGRITIVADDDPSEPAPPDGLAATEASAGPLFREEAEEDEAAPTPAPSGAPEMDDPDEDNRSTPADAPAADAAPSEKTLDFDGGTT